MNKLSIAKRTQIIGMLVEGMSLRATLRLADCSINTVTKLLVGLGDAAWAYQDQAFRNLGCRRIQCDEIWAFVYAKDKNATPELKSTGMAGDIWTWTAIDADTKLMPCWHVGNRNAATAKAFIHDLASRLDRRVQLTTDGLRLYVNAVEDAFENKIDYAMLIKQYGDAPGNGPDHKYSTGECCGAIKGAVCGNPDDAHISTSYVERANLTMRMGMRRFTRLTNGLSKKVENHAAAIALHFMYYNFGRIHKTLRVTPAMKAGLADHVWSLQEIASLI